MAIFNSYVSLPEGMKYFLFIYVCIDIIYLYIYKDVSAFLLLHFAAYLSKLGDDNKSYQQKTRKTTNIRPTSATSEGLRKSGNSATAGSEWSSLAFNESLDLVG